MKQEIAWCDVSSNSDVFVATAPLEVVSMPCATVSKGSRRWTQKEQVQWAVGQVRGDIDRKLTLDTGNKSKETLFMFCYVFQSYFANFKHFTES